MPDRGRFISFEGGEGCGKSTQVKLLSGALTERGIEHIVTREPGGTPLAERIRPLLVEAQSTQEDWNPLAETLLFLAARVQHVQEKIKPALAAGQWVICDRFTDSTLVYQGVGKGLGIEYLQNLQQQLLPDFAPDKTVLLDISPQEGLARAASRAEGEDRFEKLAISFHQKLREGFLKLAQAEHFSTIDATQTIDQVQAQVLEAVL
ncbi:MAG: dTMP kinase [Rickettsiales bacterium]|nr:dTMP kinase [Rickettsiales bacterium]